MIPAGWEASLVDSGEYFLYLASILIPLFIGASFVVGLVQQYLPPSRVERTLQAHDAGSGNVVAAVLGAATPFCSCSTIPILAGLLQAGAPLGVAFSFLLASPLVNWIAIILLFGIFGLQVTVLYAVVTLALAILGGVFIGRFELDSHIKDIDLSTGRTPITTDGGVATTRMDPEAGSPTHTERMKASGGAAWNFFTDMFPYLLLGMIVGALIHGVVPRRLILAILGPANSLAVPAAALAGAPVYITVEAMLPIAASFADHGVPIGTVLAFVIGGAGVSIPNLIMLNRLFDRRLLAVYAMTVVTVGITVGFLFNAFLV